MLTAPKKKVLCITLSLVLILSNFIGCAEASPKDNAVGVLNVKVNPEFNLYYDGEGKTVKVEAVNDDGTELLAELGDVNGMDLAEAASKLTLVIGDAGYLESIDGQPVPITITFLQGGDAETAWEPSEDLVQNVMSAVSERAEANDWMTAISITSNETVLLEAITLEENMKQPEESEPEESDESSEPEESSQEEESSKPVENSQPISNNKQPENNKKPVESSKPKEESENISVKPDPKPEVSEGDDQHSEGDLTPEQIEQLSKCKYCGKKQGEGTEGTCVRYLNGDTCPNCGAEVPARTCHTCP